VDHWLFYFLSILVGASRQHCCGFAFSINHLPVHSTGLLLTGGQAPPLQLNLGHRLPMPALRNKTP
jgi:hypothetical protein